MGGLDVGTIALLLGFGGLFGTMLLAGFVTPESARHQGDE